VNFALRNCSLVSRCRCRQILGLPAEATNDARHRGVHGSFFSLLSTAIETCERHARWFKKNEFLSFISYDYLVLHGNFLSCTRCSPRDPCPWIHPDLLLCCVLLLRSKSSALSFLAPILVTAREDRAANHSARHDSAFHFAAEKHLQRARCSVIISGSSCAVSKNEF
jgi:hypothetical protein